jgi:hypothetical protein
VVAEDSKCGDWIAVPLEVIWWFFVILFLKHRLQLNWSIDF